MSAAGTLLNPSRAGKDAETLERTLLKLVIGQDEAVEQIVNIYQMHTTGLSAPGRPVGNFLFLGPTGSGKTRTVEARRKLRFIIPTQWLKSIARSSSIARKMRGPDRRLLIHT